MGENYNIRCFKLILALTCLLLGKAIIAQTVITPLPPDVSGSDLVNAPADECTNKYTGQAEICPSGSLPFGTITAIGYNVFSGGTNAQPMKFYMNTTAGTTLANTAWNTAISGATTVYGSTNITWDVVNGANWQTVTLATPYQYSSNNLEVFSECDQGSTASCG